MKKSGRGIDIKKSLSDWNSKIKVAKAIEDSEVVLISKSDIVFLLFRF